MSILEELKDSISKMSDEEISETFRQIRLSRRTAKPKKKVTTKATTTKTPSAPPVSAMTPEMAEALLKQLGG